MPHLCISELGWHWSLNGLLPVQRQAITWTNLDLLSIGPSGTNKIWIEIQNFSFMKMHLKMSSAKWQPFCPGGDKLTLFMLIYCGTCMIIFTFSTISEHQTDTSIWNHSPWMERTHSSYITFPMDGKDPFILYKYQSCNCWTGWCYEPGHL